jgi:phage gpG-like protein
MGFNIRIEDKELNKILGNLLHDVKDFSEPLRSAGDEMLERYGTRVFEKQGADDSGHWKSLASATVNARLKHLGYYKKSSNQGPDRKILVWTGRLKGGFYKMVNSKRLEIGNRIDYFKYHQLGGGKTPKRPMLFVNNSISGLVSRHLIKHLRIRK